MNTYVLGDVHGWFEVLTDLVDLLPFDEERDRLWMVGDLVNKGPQSLEVLRWARDRHQQLGDRFVVVLGNHDLHLLAAAAGVGKERDDLRPILEAPDRDELLDWLRRRPLVHHQGGTVMVHAGLWPSWTVPDALEAADEASRVLVKHGETARRVLGSIPELTSGQVSSKNGGSKADRVARSLYAFAHLRTCTKKGVPCDYTGGLATIPAGCLPWYSVPGRRSEGVPIVFGHWAALGLHRTIDTTCLDAGCAWGGSLVALRLEDGEIFRRPSPAPPPS